MGCRFHQIIYFDLNIRKRLRDQSKELTLLLKAKKESKCNEQVLVFCVFAGTRTEDQQNASLALQQLDYHASEWKMSSNKLDLTENNGEL